MNKSGVSIGSFVLSQDSSIVRVARSADLDFLLLDFEHGTFTKESASRFIDVSAGRKPAVFARCKLNSLPDLAALFDQGLDGAILADVHSADDVKQAIHYIKFPPVGVRSLNARVPAMKYGRVDTAEFIKNENERTQLWIMAERTKLIEQLHEICRFPGLSGVFFGPYDLSMDMGCEGNINHPAVLETLHESIGRVLSHGVSAGIYAGTKEQAKHWIQMGVTLICHEVDYGILSDFWKETMNMLRNK